MHLSPDPDFEEFALDCIRLSNQEKFPWSCPRLTGHRAIVIELA